MVVEDTRAVVERACRDNGRPISDLASFDYLGRIITATDDNWLEVLFNLRKAWNKWEKILRILGWEVL